MRTDNPLVGVNFTASDKYLCEYVDFLSTKVPIKTVNNIFVFTARGSFFALQKDTNNTDGKVLLDTIEEQMKNKITPYYKNIKHIKNKAVAGLFVESVFHFFKKTNTDLIFLGKDIGSNGINSKYIIRHIPAATFIVPEKSKHKLDRVVIALDKNDYAITFLNKALQFCSKIDPAPKITILHVLHWPFLGELEEAIIENYEFYSGVNMKKKLKAQFAEDEKEFREFVKSHIKGFENLDIKVEVVQEKKHKPYHGVKKYLDHHLADLVILGSKSHSGFEAHLLGSLVEKIITVNEKTPMLVIR